MRAITSVTFRMKTVAAVSKKLNIQKVAMNPHSAVPVSRSMFKFQILRLRHPGLFALQIQEVQAHTFARNQRSLTHPLTHNSTQHAYCLKRADHRTHAHTHARTQFTVHFPSRMPRLCETVWVVSALVASAVGLQWLPEHARGGEMASVPGLLPPAPSETSVALTLDVPLDHFAGPGGEARTFPLRCVHRLHHIERHALFISGVQGMFISFAVWTIPAV